MSWRRIRRHRRRQLVVVGALLVVGVIFMLIFSATGQRPFGAPSDEGAPKGEEVATPVVGGPADEEIEEDQQPEEADRAWEQGESYHANLDADRVSRAQPPPTGPGLLPS